MGLLKSLFSAGGNPTDFEMLAPDEIRRSAAEAAVDQMIAERLAQLTDGRVPATGEVGSPPAVGERRSGGDRRVSSGVGPGGIERRQSDRRVGAPSGEFGRRVQRPN